MTTAAQVGGEVARIERALGALLRAMLDEEAGWQEPALFHIRAAPVDPARPVRTRAEMEVGQLLQEPVFFALRLAVRRLGERAHAVAGGTDGMRRIAERVADADPARGGRLLSMMDSAWDGVGAGGDVWWA